MRFNSDGYFGFIGKAASTAQQTIINVFPETEETILRSVVSGYAVTAKLGQKIEEVQISLIPIGKVFRKHTTNDDALIRYEDQDPTNFTRMSLKKLKRHRNSVSFISHKWFDVMGQARPDKNGILVDKLRIWANEMGDDALIWMDYCCTPQNEPDVAEIAAAISALPFMKLRIPPLDPGYQGSAWCMLEYSVGYKIFGSDATEEYKDLKPDLLRVFKGSDVLLMESVLCAVSTQTSLSWEWLEKMAVLCGDLLPHDELELEKHTTGQAMVLDYSELLKEKFSSDSSDDDDHGV